jgi:hypothetical protein
MTSRLVLALGLTMLNGAATAQSTYTAPAASAALVSGIDFASGKPADNRFHDRFTACDNQNICDGEVLTRFGCSSDRNRNTVILKLTGDVLFYDAKMGIDADGSQLSKNLSGTNQATTSFQYPSPESSSLDADKVSYIVVPGGDFRKSLGFEIGDIGAVIYRDHLVYAIVGDIGPKCKIGEGSIQLHEKLGHTGCAKRDTRSVCITAASSGIEKDVLYFIFPGSREKINQGLTPDNINERLNTEGQKLMDALRPPPQPMAPAAITVTVQ